MGTYNVIEPWYDVTDYLRLEHDLHTAMSREDHGFLCAIIRAVKPQKVVEIGVASGGTTCVIAKTLKELDLSSELYSVDIAERFYKDETVRTGFEYDRLREKIGYTGRQKMLLGKTIAEQIEDIGDGVDLVIIDTTHVLPGELLDFLIMLPYCKKNAMFVLHDVSFNRIKACAIDPIDVRTSGKRIATKVLLSVVVADKMMNNLNANIAAFQTNEDTWKYITDVFYALTMTWSYLLEADVVERYRGILEKHYNKDMLEIFDTAVKNNNGMLKRIEEASNSALMVLDPVRYEFPIADVPENAKVILCGAGVVGQNIYMWNEEKNYCKIIGWYDSNVKELGVSKLHNNLDELLKNDFDYIVVAVKKMEVFEEIKERILTILGGDLCEKKIVGPIKHPWDV